MHVISQIWAWYLITGNCGRISERARAKCIASLIPYILLQVFNDVIPLMFQIHHLVMTIDIGLNCSYFKLRTQITVEIIKKLDTIGHMVFKRKSLVSILFRHRSILHHRPTRSPRPDREEFDKLTIGWILADIFYNSKIYWKV